MSGPSSRIRSPTSSPFRSNTTDAVVHMVTAAVMVAVAAVQIRIDGGLRNSLADLRKAPQPK